MITHVTYAHKDKPFGDRFRQRADIALPKWACELRWEFAKPIVFRTFRIRLMIL